ncbi:alpha/beta hydrolase fold domain-containing protein [Ferruginibacter sp.]
MKLHKLLPFILFISFFISCKKTNDTSGGGTNATPAQTLPNVAYGADAQQKMDVYLPAGRTVAATKVMVMIHGGSWTTGDKIDLTAFVDTMKKRLPGYAIFNINYRLSAGTTNVFPTQENDVKTALQFIFSKSSEYLISDKYVLIGASAGAHLAMLQGYKYTMPVKPKAIVSFFGPGDLTDMYNNPVGGLTILSTVLAQAIGATPTSNPMLYTNSSPITFIAAGAPPTILLHGSTDPLVNPSQSVAVKNKLTAAGVINQYILYPGKGHGDWDNATYGNAFSNVQVFLETNVQ